MPDIILHARPLLTQSCSRETVFRKEEQPFSHSKRQDAQEWREGAASRHEVTPSWHVWVPFVGAERTQCTLRQPSLSFGVWHAYHVRRGAAMAEPS